MKLLQEQTKWIMEQNNRRLRDRAVFRVELGPHMSMWERMQLDGKTVGKVSTRWENWLSILRKIKLNPYLLHKQMLVPKRLKIYFQNYHEVNRKYINHCDLCVGKDFFQCKSTKRRKHLPDMRLPLLPLLPPWSAVPPRSPVQTVLSGPTQ